MYTQYGMPPEFLPTLELVSLSIRKQIIEGRDVNLESMLISEFEMSQVRTFHTEGCNVNVKAPPDPRLSRQLTISEFITAFGKYKRIMCSRFPARRPELDIYEAIIIEFHNLFGEKFYDYYRIFSARSAEALRMHTIKVDWSVRDKTLINLLLSGTKTKCCGQCGSIAHTTVFCHLATQDAGSDRQQWHSGMTDGDKSGRPRPPRPAAISTTDVDKYGRPRISTPRSRELCNNFNDRRCY